MCIRDRADDVLELGPEGGMSGGVLATAAAVVVCLGYNVFYFELTLPSGATAQILDLMDYISNSFLMPFISFLTCIFVG